MKPLLLSALLLSALLVNIKTPAQTGTAAKEIVAIYPFTTARGYSYDYAMDVGNAVEAGVLRSNRFKVVERNRFGSVKDEDKFKEANTSDIVAKASKMGAKIIITGHIVGVSKGDLVNSSGVSTGREYVEISMSIKIIDVATAEIKMSETIRGRGEGKNYAETAQMAYQSIDKIIRANVAAYLPQRFKFMSVVTTGTKKDVPYLEKFKIWAGSDEGLKPEDVVEIYKISTLTNPNTGKQVEEKELLAQARVVEVNGASTSTCQIIEAKRKGGVVLEGVNGDAAHIIFEYKGNWHEEKTIGEMLFGK